MNIVPLVDVVMVTYNHEKYIAQAIESVLMQNCDFKYQLIISDDASLDNTKKICRKYNQLYPDKILYLDNKANVGLVKNYKRAFDLCFAKYIGILEGDDYWIDKDKLQKQVAILENFPEIGLVHGNFYTLQNGKLITNIPKKEKFPEGELFKKLLLKNLICPLTVVFRKELFDRHIDYDLFIENNFSTIDYALWLGIAANSKINYINDFLGVYRREIGSISNTENFNKTDKFLETAFFVQNYYAKKYNLENKILKIAHNNLYYDLLSSAIYFNDFKSANKYRQLYRPNSIKGLVKWIVSIHPIIYSIFNKLGLAIQFKNI